MLREMRVTELLDAFGSPAPTPGGGSASALAAATGASLLMMVASLPKTRSNTDEERASLAREVDRLRPIRDRLAALIDRDTDAYDAVVAAYRLPKGTDEEKAARTRAIQQALREATDAPLAVMRAAAAGLESSAVVARDGSPAASSDVGVARELLSAGLRGARLNVEINLGAVKDLGYVQAVVEEVRELGALVP
jgi:formiminotetrahydrofolate cyclodeaminase